MSNVEVSYCKIPIKLLVKHNRAFPFDIFIRLSVEKVIKISRQNDEVIDILQKYNAKGIEDVYVSKKEFEAFLIDLKNSFTNKFFGATKSKTVDEAMNLLEQGHSVVKEGLGKLGVNEVVVEMAKEVSKQSMEVMKKVPNILEFYSKYKERCAPAFLRGLLVGYTCSAMIDHFSWQSSVVKLKATLAAQLCDLNLTTEEFKELTLWQRDEIPLHKLSPSIFNHPYMVAEILAVESGSANLIAPEVLTIIRQHHERPDGSGFPKALSHLKITLLSAIHIVADNFIEMMIQHHFSIDKKDMILNQISLKFSKGNFKKASEALRKMFES